MNWLQFHREIRTRKYVPHWLYHLRGRNVHALFCQSLHKVSHLEEYFWKEMSSKIKFCEQMSIKINNKIWVNSLMFLECLRVSQKCSNIPPASCISLDIKPRHTLLYNYVLIALNLAATTVVDWVNALFYFHFHNNKNVKMFTSQIITYWKYVACIRPIYLEL